MGPGGGSVGLFGRIGRVQDHPANLTQAVLIAQRVQEHYEVLQAQYPSMLAWVDQGCPEGDPTDAPPAEATFTTWPVIHAASSEQRNVTTFAMSSGVLIRFRHCIAT